MPTRRPDTLILTTSEIVNLAETERRYPEPDPGVRRSLTNGLYQRMVATLEWLKSENLRLRQESAERVTERLGASLREPVTVAEVDVLPKPVEVPVVADPVPEPVEVPVAMAGPKPDPPARLKAPRNSNSTRAPRKRKGGKEA